MLCNDYRHASPPARSESWGMVDVQVDFTGLVIIRPHRSSQDRVPAYPVGQQCTDQSRSKVGAEHPCSREELAQQLFKTDDPPRQGWASPHRPWLPGSQRRSRARDACRRQLGAMTDLRCERQLESPISRTAAAIATPPTISTNPRMLDSARIITPVT